MLISQDLFDETLLESQELFEYDDEQAVAETVTELQSQQQQGGGAMGVRMDHLSLTHPNSEQGKEDRKRQTEFVEALSSQDLTRAISIVADTKSLPMFASLVLKNGFFAPNSELTKRWERDEPNGGDDGEPAAVSELIGFVLAILPEGATTHPLVRELKLQLGKPLQESWFAYYEAFPSMRMPLVSMAHTACNGCESNKKTLVQAGIRYKAKADPSSTTGIELLLNSLPTDLESNPNEIMARELCKLLSVLGKFQAAAEPQPRDGEEPLVSSAHANVKEFYKCGAVHKLHVLAKGSIEGEKEDILCEVLSALRVMAIDNDIVQNMVAAGVLDTVNSTDQDRSLMVHRAYTAAATLGLLRNLCANDEIKSTLCRQSLPSILQAMELHSAHATVQEHGCGILAAMSLRQPQNASTITGANGGEHVVKAMKAFPLKVPLQRQGCLALRNLASRATPDEKRVLLDAGSEFVLREIAGRHQDSIDEAYAALRDLGCAAVKYTVDEQGKAQGTQLFGTVKSNFRPVYD